MNASQQNQHVANQSMAGSGLPDHDTLSMILRIKYQHSGYLSSRDMKELVFRESSSRNVSYFKAIYRLRPMPVLLSRQKSLRSLGDGPAAKKRDRKSSRELTATKSLIKSD